MGVLGDDDDMSYDMFEFEEKTDLGEDEPTSIPNQIPTYHIRPNGTSQSQRRHEENKSQRPKGRRVKVKPMPANMLQKWPDLTTVLFTLNSGKQILFVKS
jgi:hypothetical protein